MIGFWISFGTLTNPPAVGTIVAEDALVGVGLGDHRELVVPFLEVNIGSELFFPVSNPKLNIPLLQRFCSKMAKKNFVKKTLE